MTLIEFLLARIAEDQSVANACLELDAEIGHLSGWVEIGSDQVDAIEALAGRFSPTRVLAECQVKLQIVEHYQRWQPTLYRNGGPKYDAAQETMYRMAMRWVLERLALPYVSHPDYQEW